MALGLVFTAIVVVTLPLMVKNSIANYKANESEHTSIREVHSADMIDIRERVEDKMDVFQTEQRAFYFDLSDQIDSLRR